ncbi:MAG TPA: thioredoxin family protein [Dictyoglomaceae bacterium]|nr:thioredoxin family protein [Dictyoglomaceae bacterium]HOL38992.1 thioredoxin family protein [Dictyoglomaceae bacterium]HOP94331.1 thioredoxin family protein [Dictyoglomaceae bacterium]HPP15832.1 thioredoxin family protein [Dictyoglomaceae bacterium]HPU42821.1 thioredoxin family protein [Dictyoglomaceae bacterium]
MALLKDEDRQYLENLFQENLKDKVKIILFSDKSAGSKLVVPGRVECPYCQQTREILEELTSISNLLELEIHDFLADEIIAKKYNVDKIPAILFEKNNEVLNVRYFGLPSGYEFSSLIEDIMDISRGETQLSPETKKVLATVDKPVHIQVFVTPTCPYCPKAVRLAHQFAMENKFITADMVESIEFPHLAEKYGVTAVPKTIINDKVEIEGAVPENVFLEYLKSALKS